MKNNIIKCFSLKGVLVDSWSVDDEQILVKVRSPRTHALCPGCADTTDKIHDFKRRKILHGNFGSKKVILDLLVRRFRCRTCGPFTEWHPPGITRKQHTEHLADGVIERLSTSNFLETSRSNNISIPTVLSIVKERQKQIPLPEGKIILNVDEHSYRGRDLKTSVGAANHHKILAILKDDSKSTLIRYLNSWPAEARKRVSEACIDMKQSYLHAIKEVLPETKIVVDHFHVIKEMGRHVDEMRKILQQGGTSRTRRTNKMLLLKGKEKLTPEEKGKLRKMFDEYKKFPTLKYAYFVKEKVREMYRSKTKAEAERKFDMLLSQLEEYEVGKLAEM